MRNRLNLRINSFVALQIIFAIGWVFISNYLGELPGYYGQAVGSIVDFAGLMGMPAAILGFVLWVAGMLIIFIGTFLWVMAGEYRRGIGMVTLVMGIGLLFGTFAAHMRPLEEIVHDTGAVAYLQGFRAILALVVYFGMAAATASQVLEWIAREEMQDASIKIRHTHSIPLCTILPVAFLRIGYVRTMEEQFITLAFAAFILIVFTAITNRQRTRTLRLLAARSFEEAASEGQGRITRVQPRLADRRDEFPTVCL